MTKKMNRKIKKLWMQALRSGKYRQTRNMLHNKTGYCCLGVLCNIYLKEHKQKWQFDAHLKKYFIENDSGSLPTIVIKWAGLNNAIGRRKDKPSLASLNDEGKKFSTIANIIQKEF